MEELNTFISFSWFSSHFPFKQLKIFQNPHIPLGCQATPLFWREGYVSWRLCLSNLHLFPHLVPYSFPTLDNFTLLSGLFPKQFRQICLAHTFWPAVIPKMFWRYLGSRLASSWHRLGGFFFVTANVLSLLDGGKKGRTKTRKNKKETNRPTTEFLSTLW